MRLVFLLEEPSMAAFLKQLLPRLIPEDILFQLVPHQGKQDLQRSMPRKIRAMDAPNTFFIVLHDQDSQNCVELKNKLESLIRGLPAFQNNRCKIRIVCNSLESWILGDISSLRELAPRLNPEQHRNKAKFREPDRLDHPEQELRRIVPRYQKVSGSECIGKVINIEQNRSTSFQVFVRTLQEI